LLIDQFPEFICLHVVSVSVLFHLEWQQANWRQAVDETAVPIARKEK